MTTIIILNPMGTDVTSYVDGTNPIGQLLKGTIRKPGDVIVTIPYINQPGRQNVADGVEMLHAAILNAINNGATDILVFGYSEGCQIADWWLWKYGQSTPIDPARLRFWLIANANRKYGGFVCGHPIFDAVGYTNGKPADTPYRVIDFTRQYDGVSDFPTAQPVQDALIGLQTVGSDENAIVGAMKAVGAVLADNVNKTAALNAINGLLWIHNIYLYVTLNDPGNVSLVEGNITWVWSPTYPVPLLGLSTMFSSSDREKRILIEQAYQRPVQIPMPNYGSGPAWGQPAAPSPAAPVTGWWAVVAQRLRPDGALLDLAGGQPVVRVGKVAAPVAAALSIVGGAANAVISQHQNVQPAPAQFALIGSRPALGTTVRPDAETLTITGGQPEVRLSNNAIASPAPAALSLAGGTPTVKISDHKVATPAPSVLTLAGGTPQVRTPQTFTPGPAALSLAGGTPDVAVSILIRPGAATLALAGGQPVVSTPVNVVPQSAQMSLIGSRPAIGMTLRPPGAVLAISGGVPAVQLSDNKMLAPIGLPLQLAGGQPVVTASDNKSTAPAAAALAITGGVPVVSTPRLATPASAPLSLVGGTPTVTIAAVFQPFSEVNINRVNQPWPVGATEWRWRGLGGGGGAGRGFSSASSDRGGGAGGSGAAYEDSGWQPISAGGSTYSNTRGLGGTTQNDGTDSTFTSGPVALVAGGGKKGNNGSASAGGTTGAGGVATATGITPAVLADGTRGGVGGSGLSGWAGGAAPNNPSGGAPGGGGGAGMSGAGGNANGGSGGNSAAANGATGATGNATAAAGSSAPTGSPGGGGAGAAAYNNFGTAPSKPGGNGGTSGAGGGGSSGGNSGPASGGTGRDGDTILEFR